MRTIGGLMFAFAVLLAVALVGANTLAHAEAAPWYYNTAAESKPALFLQAIKLNALDGQELERHNISGPYDTVEDCSKVQQANAPQRPVVTAGGPPTITVFSCVVFNGDSAI